MTTLQDLIDYSEADLYDDTNNTWKATDIAQWLRDAIVDYSQHFPQLATQTINMTTGTNQYDLVDQLIDVISVEYPSGEDPKEYLKRRHYLHQYFWSEEGYFDVLMHYNDSDPAGLGLSRGGRGAKGGRGFWSTVGDYLKGKPKP